MMKKKLECTNLIGGLLLDWLITPCSVQIYFIEGNHLNHSKFFKSIQNLTKQFILIQYQNHITLWMILKNNLVLEK